MAQVAALARKFLRDRLLDPNTGFNFWIGQVFKDSDYGIDPRKIFNLRFGRNLFMGPVPPDVLEAVSTVSYPLCMLYTNKTTNQQLVTPAEFAGSVISVMDWYTTASKEEVSDLASLGDIIEDALHETFNRREYYGLSNPYGLIYNNQLNGIRFPPVWNGGKWTQNLREIITHTVITDGR
jgi:hypothetical protein